MKIQLPSIFTNARVIRLSVARVFRIPFKEHSLITCYPEGTDLSCLEFKGRMWFSSCPWEGWAPGLSHERLPGFIIPWHLGLFSRLLSSRNRMVLLPCYVESRAQLHSLGINHSAKLQRGEASEPAPTPCVGLCLASASWSLLLMDRFLSSSKVGGGKVKWNWMLTSTHQSQRNPRT